MKDRAMQALYLLALEPVAEATGDPNSYGFGPERSTADAVKQGFNALCRECSAQWILEGDIQGCFDHISHNSMIHHVPPDKTVLQSSSVGGTVSKGGRISPFS